MGYQKKSYKKFIATAATATLVASAIVPVASAAGYSDVAEDNEFKPFIDALSEQGIIKGYESDNTFRPYNKLTRGQVAIMLGRWLENNGETVPADWDNSRFSDVPTSNEELAQYAALVKDAGVFTGVGGKLNPNDNITREHMAVVLNRVAEQVAGVSLVELAEEVADKEVTDLNTANADYRDAIQALVDLEISTVSNFRPKEELSRAQFAKFLYNTIEIIEEAMVVPTLKVESVSAINHKELKITGEALDLASAKDFTLEGNTVASYEVSEDKMSATLTFEKSFDLDKELTLMYIEKIEGEEDKVTEFTFTYSLDIDSASSNDVRLDENKDKQYLYFMINDERIAANVESLKAAGYTVEFQTTSDVLVDASTGEIDETKITSGDKFAYKVVITKGDVKIETELKEATVLDFTTYVSAIGETKVSQGSVTVKSGKVSVQDGTAKLEVGKVTSLSGVTVSAPTLTYKSSNPSVATIDERGNITPIKPGSVVFTVTSNDAKVEVPMTVTSGARVATTVAPSSSSVKLYNANSDTVAFTVVDQYGDEFEGDVTIVSKNTDITNAVDQTVTVVDGKGAFNVTPVAAAKGNTTLEIKNADGTKVLKTVSVSISDDATIASRKLEVSNSADDMNLDVVFGSDDTQVELLWNTYNKDGFKIGSEKVAGGAYTVSSSNTNVADVTVESDNQTMTVTGKKAGTANILIKEGTVTRASVTITVSDSTPTIKSVNFEEVKDITSAGALSDVVVLKPANITLSDSTLKAQLDTNGDIFVDLNGNAIKDAEEVLGTLAVKYSGTSSDFTVGPTISSGMVEGTVAAKADGTLVVYVIETDEVVPLATSTINVKTN